MDYIKAQYGLQYSSSMALALYPPLEIPLREPRRSLETRGNTILGPKESPWNRRGEVAEVVDAQPRRSVSRGT